MQRLWLELLSGVFTQEIKRGKSGGLEVKGLLNSFKKNEKK